MAITQRELDELVDADVIDRATAGRIASHLRERADDRGRFDLTHLAYYLGAAVVLAGLFWFMAEAFARYGGWVLVITAATYGAVFVALGERFWRRPGYRIPGGLLFTTAVAMAPLLAFGLLNAAGVWPESRRPTAYFQVINGHTMTLELVTIGAALLALRRRPFPFLMVPLCLALWLLALDATPLILGELGGVDEWRIGSAGIGLAMMAGGYALDRAGKPSFATWSYLTGLLAFWGAITTGFEFHPGYAALNFALLFIALLLQRRTFAVFGGIGLFIYLGELASDVFRDSLLFPATLAAVGLGFILFGVWYSRRADAIRSGIMARLPGWVARGLPGEADIDPPRPPAP